MRESLIAGPIFGAMIAIGSGATASVELSENKTAHAAVRQVTPVMRAMRTPKWVCRDEEVLYVQPRRDSRKVRGTVLGAIVGGVLGNQIGSGDGRKIATGAGALAGAYAGNRVQSKTTTDNVFSNVERRCSTMFESTNVLIGYDVRYQIGNMPIAQVRTNYDPGKSIPLRDGKLVLDGKTRNL